MKSRTMDRDDGLDAEVEECEWFDWWCEEACNLRDAEDFAGYVAHCEERVKRDPEDSCGVAALGEAFLLHKEPEKAIEVVTPGYREDPDHEFGEEIILEALQALGRPMEDFPWLRPPRVVHLDRTLLNECERYLKRKRKAVDLLSLHCEFEFRGFLLFSEEDLGRALEEDGRFVVTDHERGPLRWVAVKR